MLELPVLDIVSNPQNPRILQNPTGSESISGPSVPSGPTLYVETYGCQMNINDTEIVQGVMSKSGYSMTDAPEKADIILLNTCAIRDNAEKKIHERLNHLKFYKKKNRDLVVGILGCMAERLRENLLEKELVDIVIGPDEYRSVPELVEKAFSGEKGIAVKLSRVETYDDILPLRTEGISAWVSIMRGCDKFCTFCVVPFTRGRERSRAMHSVVDEVKHLWDSGFREVTLLGQNVNSYLDEQSANNFAQLLAACAKAVPGMRIRYTTSHPKDMSDELIATMAEYDNICKYIHLPVQSGSDRILQLMNRTYSVQHYMERIAKIREFMPGCALSTDIITGFPTETDQDHEMTMELMRQVRYDGAYMFKYSPRERTKAWKMGDDVPDQVKIHRLNQIIAQQNTISWEINQQSINTTESVLVEGPSKKNQAEWQGRTDTNKVVIFPQNEHTSYIVGDLVKVQIERASSATLFGQIVG
jgi:tRNA-2-methylthio-N6-dimethylallyladenosine synthase